MDLKRNNPFKDPYFYGALVTLLASGAITVLIFYGMFFYK
jgi:hypothetical protein